MDIMIHRLKSENNDGNHIYVQREDLLPFSMGGNKVRIAEAFFQDMKKKGCDTMIMYGSRHSNLCRVLSNLCYSNGVESYMICSHSGETDYKKTFNTYMVDWCGVQIVHCEVSKIAETVEKLINELKDSGKKPYYIYGDKFGKGNEGTAASAYAKVYPEIISYEKQQGWEFDYIFCPCGTGATHSGLVCGHLLSGDAKKIYGLMISSRETARAYQVAEDGIRSYFKDNDEMLPDNFLEEIALINYTDRLGGYGIYHEEVKQCIRKQYQINGIPLDPVYTGKAFLSMQMFIKEKEIKNSRILFLHTGGTPLFYDYLESEGETLC